MKHALITGGTGFIGSKICAALHDKGYKVTILTRTPEAVKSPYKAINTLSVINKNEVIDVMINLAGAPISKRWTKNHKQTLQTSRHTTTQNIIDLIHRLTQKPKVFISASAIGYYGSQSPRIRLDEEANPRIGFTHSLCKKWEAIAQKAKDDGVRVCITRIGVVMGNDGGALSRMLPPFKFGAGGIIGDGQQMFSWVHINDVVAAFLYLIDHKTCKGVFNLTAPYPVDNKHFTKTLGKVLHRPTFLPMPACVVKAIFGEMGQTLLLEGQKVVPTRLQKAGFAFQYPKLERALQNILVKNSV